MQCSARSKRMKKILTLILAGFIFQFSGIAAQNAQSRLFCISPKIYTSTDDSDFFSLSLSTINAGNNGELGPYFYFFNPNTTHAAYLDVVDELFLDHYAGAMDLDVPSTDVDGDAYADIFESSLDFNGSSLG